MADLYRECIKKKRYRSLKLANEIAAQALKSRGVNLRVYGCPYCNGYHLTKQNP